MGNFPSGGISYLLGSSILDDEDIVPQAGKRANAPKQIVQKIKLRKLSGFLVLFPILASLDLLKLFLLTGPALPVPKTGWDRESPLGQNTLSAL